MRRVAEEEYMRMALALAARGRGRTSPNPMVGAVLVRDDRVVGKGYHARAGLPHAEVVAIAEAGPAARGSTLYVNLEPCCHTGRTGPCTEAIIEAGIARVVVAMRDPNPLVAGKGLSRLRAAGIEVEEGLLAQEAAQLNEVFIKYITTGLPFVVLKAAVSLDGKIATRTGASQWITGPAAREYVHRLRDTYDAVMVGIGTVLHDNPSLTTRLPEGGRDPRRVVLDSMARTPLDAKVLTQDGAATIIAVTEQAPAERVAALRKRGAEVLVCGPGPRVDVLLLAKELAHREITSVLAEGGAGINGALLASGLVDKVIFFIAPLIIGGEGAPGPVGGRGAASLAEALRLENYHWRQIGQDLCCEGYLRRGEQGVYGDR
ncbi:MAG: bifunctional diaminohydroxyphosphoribosylaminopyrimidine deaminase/5-amino-6-(5-phosphoribosylamino)uracil reductase RibD [Bacillota bacterium]